MNCENKTNKINAKYKYFFLYLLNVIKILILYKKLVIIVHKNY